MHNLVSLSILLGLSAAGYAATFTVNTTSDLSSDNCTGGTCSLRGAMLAANATPVEDTIAFNIPQSDPGFHARTQHWRINIGANALPVIAAPVLIDGYTQPGAIPNTLTPAQGGLNSVLKIELEGVFSSSTVGLDLRGYPSQLASVFRGLVIHGFHQTQILLAGTTTHRVEGCYIGTDVQGNTAHFFGQLGINIFDHHGSPQIGGLLPAQRNLISSQASAITGAGSVDGLVIQGNLIGLNRAGTAALLNLNTNLPAIRFRGPIRNSLIGGDQPNARNVIAGNKFGAIRLATSSAGTGASGTRIEGNYIGTDVSGTRAIGNGYANSPQPGLDIFGFPSPGDVCTYSVGGTSPGQANLISFSAGPGIAVAACTGLRMPFNRFLGNAGLAVDLGNDGATSNDINDADEGSNRLQNYPELTLPVAGSNSLSYRVDTATSSATYPITVNFYRAGCGGGSDALLASTTISAAQAQQTLILDTNNLGNLLPLTASAMDADGNTSEFAPMLGDEFMRAGFEDTLAALVPGTCQ